MATEDDEDGATDRLSARDAARMSAEAVAAAATHPLLILDEDLSVDLANDAFYREFHTTPQETLGHALANLAGGILDRSELRSLIHATQSSGNPFEGFQVEGDIAGVGWRAVALRGQRIDPFRMIALALRPRFQDASQGEWPRTPTRHAQHQVRNVLANVRALLHRTDDDSRSVDEFVDAFDGRLGALSRIENLVMRTFPAWIDLHELVLDELHAHGARANGNLSIDGPDVRVEPRVARTLASTVHELASNSVKFGALAEDGAITFRWDLRGDGDQRRLEMEWHETAVAGSGAGGRHGFGRRLIEELVPYELGGNSQLDIEPPTLTCRITFPCNDRVIPVQSTLGDA